LVGGAVARQYTYGLQRISQGQFISNQWTDSFYGYDGGGNVRNLTSSAGAITDEYEYDAFGNSFTKVGTTPNNYLYRGEQFDTDLGLYYLRARYYNPLTGRFLSRDPKDGKFWDPKTLHRYLYAGGAPVNRIDPSGRDLVEFALTLTRSVKAGATYAAIGCGAQLGFMFAAGNLSESFRDPIGDVYYFGGCAQMFFSGANDTATLALDVFGLASWQMDSYRW